MSIPIESIDAHLKCLSLLINDKSFNNDHYQLINLEATFKPYPKEDTKEVLCKYYKMQQAEIVYKIENYYKKRGLCTKQDVSKRPFEEKTKEIRYFKLIIRKKYQEYQNYLLNLNKMFGTKIALKVEYKYGHSLYGEASRCGSEYQLVQSSYEEIFTDRWSHYRSELTGCNGTFKVNRSFDRKNLKISYGEEEMESEPTILQNVLHFHLIKKNTPEEYLEIFIILERGKKGNYTIYGIKKKNKILEIAEGKYDYCFGSYQLSDDRIILLVQIKSDLMFDILDLSKVETKYSTLYFIQNNSFTTKIKKYLHVRDLTTKIIEIIPINKNQNDGLKEQLKNILPSEIRINTELIIEYICSEPTIWNLDTDQPAI